MGEGANRSLTGLEVADFAQPSRDAEWNARTDWTERLDSLSAMPLETREDDARGRESISHL